MSEAAAAGRWAWASVEAALEVSNVASCSNGKAVVSAQRLWNAAEQREGQSACGLLFFSSEPRSDSHVEFCCLLLRGCCISVTRCCCCCFRCSGLLAFMQRSSPRTVSHQLQLQLLQMLLVLLLLLLHSLLHLLPQIWL